MDDYEKSIRQRLKDDFPHYAKKCLKIRTKSGDIVPLILNQAQSYLHECIESQEKVLDYVRILALKGRQQGISTYVGARYYHKTTHRLGVQTYILAHESSATDNLYEMVQRYYAHTPTEVKPVASKSNAKQLLFGRLDSGYKLGTSENPSLGRSSTIQYFHWSEVAYSKHTDSHVKGVLQAVPTMPGTEIILESTANGVGNYFHQEWQKAEAGLSDFLAVFIPWFWQPEYARKIDDSFVPTEEELELSELYKLSYEQLNWRRSKIVELSSNGQDGNKAFKTEYPCNPNEAFQLTGEDSYIPSDLVMKARKAEVEPYGPLVMGVDVARFGDDRTAIVFRQGRKVFGLESYSKKDTMEVTGIVHSLIEKHKPAKVCVDVGGLGAGVVDRLKELEHDNIVAVNAGAKPLDAKRYFNKRSEMWGNLHEWLSADIPCQIPDDDSLHADLCGIRYTVDSSSRLKMESKADMKKRGIRSPDLADCVCLTLALPESALSGTTNKRRANVLESLVQGQSQRAKALSSKPNTFNGFGNG